MFRCEQKYTWNVSRTNLLTVTLKLSTFFLETRFLKIRKFQMQLIVIPISSCIWQCYQCPIPFNMYTRSTCVRNRRCDKRNSFLFVRYENLFSKHLLWRNRYHLCYVSVASSSIIVLPIEYTNARATCFAARLKHAIREVIESWVGWGEKVEALDRCWLGGARGILSFIHRPLNSLTLTHFSIPFSFSSPSVS